MSGAAGAATGQISGGGPGAGPLFHVVLHRPEIPNNTGNIGRTCVALGCALHLIHPLGFSLDEKARRRAGLDYWARLDLRQHESWEAYTGVAGSGRLWLATTRAATPLHALEVRRGDHLVFGGETRGLPESILAAHREQCFSLPMRAGERSLNVATAVCAAVYVGLDRLLARGEAALDASGRLA